MYPLESQYSGFIDETNFAEFEVKIPLRAFQLDVYSTSTSLITICSIHLKVK